jgi:hypothetical protein
LSAAARVPERVSSDFFDQVGAHTGLKWVWHRKSTKSVAASKTVFAPHFPHLLIGLEFAAASSSFRVSYRGLLLWGKRHRRFVLHRDKPENHARDVVLRVSGKAACCFEGSIEKFCRLRKISDEYSSGAAQGQAGPHIAERGDERVDIGVAVQWRRSSSLGVGGTVMAQTRGSPRCQAISVRSSAARHGAPAPDPDVARASAWANGSTPN